MFYIEFSKNHVHPITALLATYFYLPEGTDSSICLVWIQQIHAEYTMNYLSRLSVR